jgi:hypothetical protein
MKGYKILVLDRGFVVCGYIEPSSELAFHWCFSGCTIRVWGTTEGLTELCDGPTNITKLDRKASEHIPFRAVLRVIDLTEEGEKKWKKVL